MDNGGMNKKEKPMRVEWIEEMRFKATTPGGKEFLLDGDSAAGPSPMDALLAALCGCMAIDVVNILKKMRSDLVALSVEATGHRNEEAPRYFKGIHLHFNVKGEIPREKIDRAIDLSFKTYCSVFHSLRKDLETSVSVEQT